MTLALSLILILLVSMALPIGIAYASQLFEYYNVATYSSGLIICENRWVAQTFTAESDHSVTSVRLPLRREGDPGMVTVSIQGTDENGHPNGTELASETIAGSTLPAAGGVWTEIFFTTPCNLTGGQKYAIVVRAPFAVYDPDYEFVVWYMGYDWGAGTYDEGNLEESQNGGSTWSSSTTSDLQFEVYGDEPPPPPPVGGELYPVDKLAVIVPWITLTAIIAGGIGVLLIRRKAHKQI